LSKSGLGCGTANDTMYLPSTLICSGFLMLSTEVWNGPSPVRPSLRCQVHLTSSAVSSLPQLLLTPRRRWNRALRPPEPTPHVSARQPPRPTLYALSSSPLPSS